ncbi:MAG: hypothetical protein HY074_15975, partial [Deltaproteobacteria bacterium]|nr:hypothetical protein [Deltaproteobacteria bacterium]
TAAVRAAPTVDRLTAIPTAADASVRAEPKEPSKRLGTSNAGEVGGAEAVQFDKPVPAAVVTPGPAAVGGAEAVKFGK